MSQKDIRALIEAVFYRDEDAARAAFQKDFSERIIGHFKGLAESTMKNVLISELDEKELENMRKSSEHMEKRREKSQKDYEEMLNVIKDQGEKVKTRGQKHLEDVKEYTKDKLEDLKWKLKGMNPRPHQMKELPPGKRRRTMPVGIEKSTGPKQGQSQGPGSAPERWPWMKKEPTAVEKAAKLAGDHPYIAGGAAAAAAGAIGVGAYQIYKRKKFTKVKMNEAKEPTVSPPKMGSGRKEWDHKIPNLRKPKPGAVERATDFASSHPISLSAGAAAAIAAGGIAFAKWKMRATKKHGEAAVNSAIKKAKAKK